MYLFLAQVQSQCRVHREWRELSRESQIQYFAAIRCLRAKPPKLVSTWSTSGWEDFVVLHERFMWESHSSPAFLPWHRGFLAIYHQAIRDCGYTGDMPYWDWSFDSQDFANSPVLKMFSYREGSKNPKCIRMYSVGNLVSNYPTSHCVAHDFTSLYRDKDRNSGQYSPAQLQQILARPTYHSFRVGLETGPHNSIHENLRGDMYSVSAAPNHPLFFMHHLFIDKLWWIWQNSAPGRRRAYGGGQNSRVSVNDPLRYMGLHTRITVADALDASRPIEGLACFSYSNSITSVEQSSNTLQRRALEYTAVNESKKGKKGKKETGMKGKKETGMKGKKETGKKAKKAKLLRKRALKKGGKLKCPKPASDEFLAQFNYSAAEMEDIREDEAILEKFTNWLNDQKRNIAYNMNNLDHGRYFGVRERTNEEAEKDTQELKKLCAEFSLNLGKVKGKKYNEKNVNEKKDKGKKVYGKKVNEKKVNGKTDKGKKNY